MRIARRFSVAGSDPLASVAFKHVDVDMCHSDPDEHCCLTDIEVPASWSYAASQLFAKHFLTRELLPALTLRVAEKGVPVYLQRSLADKDAIAALPADQRVRRESSARQVFLRLVGAWTYHGFRAGYFDTEEDAQAFHDEMLYLLAHQMAAPNSLQWRHNGIHWAYGIEGPVTAGFAVADDGRRLVKANRAYPFPQLHAAMLHPCKQASGEDALTHLVERDRKVLRVGASSGSNLSALAVSKDVDLVTLLAARDKASAQSIGGGFGRKPMMACVVDLDHKDAEAVLRFKPEEQYKAAALMLGARTLRKHLSRVLAAALAAKCDLQEEGLKRAIREARRALVPNAALERVLAYAREGYTEVHIPVYGAEESSALFQTVAGHHSRLVVRVKDADLSASRQKMEEWEHSAWSSGEPALMFADNITPWHGCLGTGEVQSMSPMGEFLFLDNTALPLAALNADAFVTDDGAFDLDGFRHASRLMTVMLDISVDMAQYPTRDMARLTADTRPLGLSMANVAVALMRHGLAYDSDEGREVAAGLAGLMTAEAYCASSEMARELGAFEAFDDNRIPMMRVLNRHRQAVQAMGEGSRNQQALVQMLHRAWDQALIWAEAYGTRNAQTTCIAPTQTIAQVMDAATIGLAPMRHYVFLAPQSEGRARKYVHDAVLSGLAVCGYGVSEREDIVAFLLGKGTLAGCGAISHAMLREKGFGDREIAAVEEALRESLDLVSAFDPWIVGERFCRSVLRISDAELFDASFDLLGRLGFSAAQIAAADGYACGSKNMEGAPHLQPGHRHVFACYAPDMPHKDAHAVGAESQLSMLGAVQPMISGGIAHTITLPFAARMESFGALARKAHALGLKTLSLSRHASPLYADIADLVHEVEEEHGTSGPSLAPLMSAEMLARQFARQAIAVRRELPQRRNGFTQKVTIGGHTLYLRTGEYESGEVGEVFIDMPGMQEEYRGLMQQFARMISLALQYGVPLDALVRAFCDMPFTPSGAIEGSQTVNDACSVLDYIFHELSHSYGAVKEMPVKEDAGRVVPLSAAAKVI